MKLGSRGLVSRWTGNATRRLRRRRTCSRKLRWVGWLAGSSSRGLLKSTLAFRPIECTLYRLVDAYLPTEVFSCVTSCNFREAAHRVYCVESQPRRCNIYARSRAPDVPWHARCVLYIFSRQKSPRSVRFRDLSFSLSHTYREETTAIDHVRCSFCHEYL